MSDRATWAEIRQLLDEGWTVIDNPTGLRILSVMHIARNAGEVTLIKHANERGYPMVTRYAHTHTHTRVRVDV